MTPQPRPRRRQLARVKEEEEEAGSAECESAVEEEEEEGGLQLEEEEDEEDSAADESAEEEEEAKKGAKGKAAERAVSWCKVGARLEAGDADKKRCCVEALQVDQERALAWACLGTCGGGIFEGRSFVAKACFLKAVEIDPRYARLQELFGRS